MLYDILFIDDDFEKETDSVSWEENAKKLFLEFIRDNLRVTYTTGELEDLDKLGTQDLSCIKYIFCDLHLEGITKNSAVKDINSKLQGIFKKFNEQITSKEVTVFINSRFVDAQYREEGMKDLCSILNQEKYKIEVIESKNNLSTEQKKKLIQNTIKIYSKYFIINKATEVEAAFDDKLSLSPTTKKN